MNRMFEEAPLPRYFADVFRLIALALLLMVAAPQPGFAQQAGFDPTAKAVKEADLLKALKGDEAIRGRVSIPDQRSANLEQPEGHAWRIFRTETLPRIGAIAILGMLVVLCLFYAIRGKIRIAGGPSKERIARFNALERFTHWLTASSFIILAISGLNVTFGRRLILPLVGGEAFTAFSAFAKELHNFLGFAFMIGVALMFLLWVAQNIPNGHDLKWVLEGGGLLPNGKHPAAGKFNAGQKGVFWAVVVGGALMSLSGIHLLFPSDAAGGIAELQWQSQVHGVVAMLMVAMILAHIYIGSLGMEGAFDAMGTGNVDLNWAKEHHSLWVDETLSKRDGKIHPARVAPAE